MLGFHISLPTVLMIIIVYSYEEISDNRRTHTNYRHGAQKPSELIEQLVHAKTKDAVLSTLVLFTKRV